MANEDKKSPSPAPKPTPTPSKVPTNDGWERKDSNNGPVRKEYGNLIRESEEVRDSLPPPKKDKS